MRMLLKRYYCIKHMDKAMSGLACLATVAKQYGLKVSILKLREISLADKNGVSVLGLIKAASNLKFSAKGVEFQTDESFSGIPLPTIAQIEKDGYAMYYVVIHKMNCRGFLIADPIEGMRYYSQDDFYQVWSKRLIILTPRENFESGNLNVGLLPRFFYLIYGQKKILFEVILASVILTILGICSAFFFKFFIDDILPNKLQDTLIIFSCGLLLINLFSKLIGAFRNHLLLYISQKIDISLILQYYGHVLELPMNFFSLRKTGEILSRSRDAQKIRSILSHSTISVLLDSIMVVIGGIIVYTQNATIFFTILITLALYFAIVFIFRYPYRRLNRETMEQLAESQSFLVEAISGIATIKAHNAEKETHLEIEKQYIRFMKLNFKLSWLGNLQSFLKEVIADVRSLLIWLIGGLQFFQGDITLGQLMTINALISYFIRPVQNLTNLQSTLQEAYVAAERMVEILDLETEKQAESQKIQIQKIEGDIEFKNVIFRYGGGKVVLDNINLNIKAGEKVALVGETGCGKTTLAKLLLKFYVPEKGTILIDGYNINDINMESLRECVGYVPQESYLFGGTIRDNIAFGTPNATLNEIIDAAKKAHIHEFIEEMTLRYDAIIAEKGGSLSGGQRQRISIARELLKNPDLLILDEATSNLDSLTEKAIHNTLDNISQKTTTIIIAHRLSTIVNCDQIIVMDKGRIIECGNHYELLQNKGKYCQMWNVQPDKQDKIGLEEKVS